MPSQRYLLPAESTFYPISLNHPYPAYLTTTCKAIRDTLFVDYRKKQVELVRYYVSGVREGALSSEAKPLPGTLLFSYAFNEFDEYMDYVNSLQFREDWKSGSPFYNLVETKRDAFNLLDIQIPVKMPAWARRVVGSEGPRLTISGRFRLILGGNSHWKKGAESIENQKEGWPDISVNQEMNFTVTGKIGRLINVSISTDNTQDVTDQLKKQLKIQYKGETEEELEDEIVQEVEAGYTSFSMPGAEFDGYSESHEGLFGIKARMKLGDLQLTTIVSQEEGQTESKKFNPSQNEEEKVYSDFDVKYDKVFFLDSNYYHYYYRDYFKSSPKKPPKITRIVLLKIDPNVTKQSLDTKPSDEKNTYRNLAAGYYKILNRFDAESGSQSDYTVDEENGIIILRVALSNDPGEELLAYFETADGRRSEQDSLLRYYYQNSAVPESVLVEGQTIHPFQLRPSDFRNDDWQWRLSWKTVYDLGFIEEQNRGRVKVRVQYHDANNQLQERAVIDGRDTLLSDYFGLTEKNVVKVKDGHIFNFDEELLILPAQLGPMPFADTAHIRAPLKTNGTIYQYTNYYLPPDKFSEQFAITITAVRKASSSISLGVINVVEGSEKVMLGGTPLVRDVDYVIQYDVGLITLISDRALTSMSEINVEFEYAPFFIPEQKTFMGARLEYQLPNIGTGSSISASFLRKNETSQDKRPQLGREPSTNMLFDINGKLGFEPDWMTLAVNKLPLINTEEKSSFVLSAEYAHSMVTPNTNSRKEALVDDFEDAKTLYSLQLSDALWHWASPPDTGVIGRFDSLQCWGGSGRETGGLLKDVGWFAWYTRDTTQVSIWPGSANNQTRWRFLELQMRPHERVRGGGPSESWFKKGSWGGMMASLGLGVKNQLNNAQFLEIVVKVEEGAKDKGVLHIDLGQISEDLRIRERSGWEYGRDTTTIVITNTSPDNQYNDEWYLGATVTTTRNDLGLDMRPDANEWFFAPVQFGSSIVFDTITANKVSDPAGDNYRWQVGSTDFMSFNGTQNNATGANADSRKLYAPDNEDVFTSNSRVDRINSYFHYWIDLNKDSRLDGEPYFESQTRTGWRLYRIPLTGRKVTGKAFLDSIPFRIGNANLADAKGIRLWMDSLTALTRIQIAKIEIVGNKWNTNLVSADSASDTVRHAKLDVSVINTVDNQSEYTHPSFVPQYYDDNDESVKAREQSLMLTYDSLTLAQPERRAVYTTQLRMDFRLYKKLVFYYNPVERKRNNLSDSRDHVFLFFRFGTDSLNYYEYRVYPGQNTSWDSVTIDLVKIAQLKQLASEHRVNLTDRVDTLAGNLRVLGGPSIGSVQWMAFGFQVDSNRVISENDIYRGRYYIDDVKLVEPDEMTGNAARVNFSGRFADVLDFSTGTYYKDGSFLRLSEKRQGAGQSEFSTNMTTTLQMHKFTPARWGLSLPLTVTTNTNIVRPRYITNSDVFLSDDGLSDMAPEALAFLVGREPEKPTANEGFSKRYETIAVTRSLQSSYKKNTESDLLLLNLTADRLATSGGVSVTDKREPSQDAKNYNYTNSLTYRASPKGETSVTPFVNSQSRLMRDHFSDLKLYYYPKTLDFNVYDANFFRTHTSVHDYAATYADERSASSTFGMKISHSYDLNLPILDWKHLNMGLTHSNRVDRDLNEAAMAQQGFPAGQVVRWDPNFLLENRFSLFPQHFILKGEQNNTQDFSYYVEPSFVSWLKHDFDYRSNYSHNVALQKQGDSTHDFLNLSQGTQFGSDVRWMFVDMLDKAFSGSSTVSGTSPFKKIKTFFDYLNFNQIGFNYSVDVSRKVSNLMQVPLSPNGFFAFRSGFYGLTPYSLVTGDDNEYLFGGWKFLDRAGNQRYFLTGQSSSDKRDVKQSAGTNMGLTLPFLLNLNLNNRLSFSRNYYELVHQTTVDTSVTFPDYQLTATLPDLMPVFKKIPILRDRLSRSTASSGFSYKKTLGIRFKPNVDSVRWEEAAFDYGLSPLLRLDMDLKNNIRLSNQLDWTRRLQYQTQENSEGTEDYHIADQVTLSYTIQKNRTLRLLFWDLTMNNQLDVGTNYQYALDWSYKWPTHGGRYKSYVEYNSKTPVYVRKVRMKKIGANAKYHITNKMNAGGEFSWSKNADITASDDEAAEDAKIDYNIVVNIWVEWNF